MLIDLSIVTLVSILYYLLCSRSRIINLVSGMLLILLLCWAVGVNVTYEASVSEIEFIVVVIIINICITVHSHHIVDMTNHSRMTRYHHHHGDHIYTVRNRLNNFHLHGISDHFKATPKTYLRSLTYQINQLDNYVRKHSDYLNFKQMIKSLTVLQSEIDDINYHLDLAMQINFPRGLKRLINQYRRIIKDYEQENLAVKQEKAVVNLLNHGMPNNNHNYTYLHVTLRFPYQRLIHDRVKHQIDLLNINQRGVFAFTLLNTQSKELNVNASDEVANHQLNSKRYHELNATLNLKKKVNLDLDTLNYLIPNKITITPYVAVVCTDPNVKINLADPQFKIIKPQDLNTMMSKMHPVLTPGQVVDIKNQFRDCFSSGKKYEWLVFNTHVKHDIHELLWYQQQVKSLDHKLMD